LGQNSMVKSNTGLSRRGSCPNCGTKGKPIVYGLPQKPSQDIVIGGCIVMPGLDPEFRCDVCEIDFGHGGRKFLVEFFLDDIPEPWEHPFESTRPGAINLMALEENELLRLGAWNLEARHELAFRGYPQKLLEELEIRLEWQSLPLKPLAAIWFYWNKVNQRVLLCQKFFSHGYRHVRQIVEFKAQDKDGHDLSEVEATLDSQFSNGEIVVWNLRKFTSEGTEARLSVNPIYRAIKQQTQVYKETLEEYCSAVPDAQPVPSWFNYSLEGR